MPKNKSRAPQTSDTKEARLVAAQNFIKGDRVRHQVTGKIGHFDSINLGFALPEAWVQFETDTEFRVPISCNPIELELVEQCNDSTQPCANSVESTACAIEQLEKPDEIKENKSPSSLSCTPNNESSSPDTTHTFLVTTTSETSVQSEESLMSSAAGFHVRESVEHLPTKEDLTSIALDSGTNCSELSTSANPDSSSGTQAVPPDIQNQDSDIQLLEEFSGVLPSAGSMLNGKLFQEPHSERPTRGNGYSLLPTPMAHSRASEEYRNPGQDKLEQKLREIGAIPPGEVSKPEFREWMMGFPEGWTDITQPDSGQLTLPLVTSASLNVASPIEQKEPPPLETLADPNRPESKGDESDISPDCFRPGMRVWSERTITHKDKPDQVIRMTGMVVRTTSRQIVPDQTSDLPIDTPLVEVQWDGVKSIVLLSPGELHMESSSDQATTDTPALTSQNAVVPEVVEELTESEALERHRLELKVERAFFEAGAGLRVLRDKRLYRSTHRTFEDYCRERFGFQRRHSYQLIDAAGVFDNLCAIGAQNQNPRWETNGAQILPTSERQIRPLTTLKPEEQRSVWQQAVEQAGGRVPSGRIVKGIVERLKEKPMLKATDFCQPNQVFTLMGLLGQERKYNGCPGVAISVNDFTVMVDVHDAVLTVKPDNLNSIDSPDVHRQLPHILKRIKRLRQCDLDRGAYYVLEGLGRQTYLTDFEADLLAFMEQRYGIE